MKFLLVGDQSVGGKVQSLCPMEAEFTRPAWIFGISSFGFFGDSGDQIVCAYRFLSRAQFCPRILFLLAAICHKEFE